MNRSKMKILAAALACTVMLTLTGCTTWRDETGSHFMLFGERGPSGNVTETASDGANNADSDTAQ